MPGPRWTRQLSIMTMSLRRNPNQAIFDIGEEHFSGHGTLDHHWGDHFIVTQSGHEGDRLPSSKRNSANHPDATRGSPSQSHHVRADGGLVDKHQNQPQFALAFSRPTQPSLSKKALQAAERQRADVARARRRWIREQG